jgi:DNA-binding GntR family transcriptional regulator
MTTSSLDAPPFKNAAEYAYEELRKRILSGEIAGGVKLNQIELASDLRVSRTPVRQAFLRLASEGLVTNRPNHGSVVTSLGSEEILELFEMRSVLEGFAASLAVRHLDSRSAGALERCIATLDAARSAPERWIGRHNGFHDLVCSLAKRPQLAADVHRLRQRVVPYLRLYLCANSGAEIPGFEHRALFDVLLSGNPEKAERIMREHVMTAALGVVEFVRTQGEALDATPA